jgi:hypothetical protein
MIGYRLQYKYSCQFADKPFQVLLIQICSALLQNKNSLRTPEAER